MFFSSKQILLGAACLGLASLARADDCENGPWTDVSSTGGQGGARFCATKHVDGIVVTGVEVWANNKAVQAVQMYYSDGTNSDVFGKINGDKHDILKWDPATDGISQIRTWGNGRGQYLGRVNIRTKAGKELDVGKDTSGQNVFETNVASGIMLGAYGNSADQIDSMGFLFLKSKVDKITIDDVVFKDTPEALNSKKEGLKTVTLDYADHTNNNSNSTETFTFGKSESRSVSKKYANTATNTFGFSEAVTISGEILDLGVSSTTTLSYGYSHTSTEESTTEQTVTLTYTVATVLAPGQRTFCKATAMMGTYDGEYDSTVNVYLEDGTTFGFKQGGTVSQVNWSQASSVCQDKEFPATKRAMKFIA